MAPNKAEAEIPKDFVPYKPVLYGPIMDDIILSIKAQSKIMYIVTNEEERIIKELHSVIWDKSHSFNEDRNNELWMWSAGTGLREVTKHYAFQPYNTNTADLDGCRLRDINKKYFPLYNQIDKDVMGQTLMLAPALNYIYNKLTGTSDPGSISNPNDKDGTVKFGSVATHRLFILADFDKIAPSDPTGVRRLKDFVQDQVITSGKVRTNFIIVSNTLNVPRELASMVEIHDYTLPSRPQIEYFVNKYLKQLSVKKKTKKLDDNQLKTEYTEQEFNDVVRACQGLTASDIVLQLAKSRHAMNKLDPAFILKAKEQIVRKGDILTWINTDVALNSVGGMKNLKDWFAQRKNSFSDEAKKFGIQSPKGVLMVGIPGTGKSLSAKALGSVWGVPLLHLDIGKVMSGIVGSSEARIREAIKIAEAVAPCVLWLDEIERGLSGTGSSNFSDGGTMDRVVGYLLNWMQEKKSDVFVVATANDVSKLPPQLLRKGRFDELFFVDLPGRDERKEIFDIHIKKRNQSLDSIDLDMLADATPGFSGSEIEAAINDAMHMAWNSKDRKLTNKLILAEVNKTIPLSEALTEQIEGIKKLASRMRFASDNSLNSSLNRRDKKAKVIPKNGVVAADLLDETMEAE